METKFEVLTVLKQMLQISTDRTLKVSHFFFTWLAGWLGGCLTDWQDCMFTYPGWLYIIGGTEGGITVNDVVEKLTGYFCSIIGNDIHQERENI